MLASQTSDNKRTPQILTIDELYNALRARDALFPARYFAYHIYRSRGWVPKSGIKYGCDFGVSPERPAQRCLASLGALS
jgi:tRNA-splicing endonuclease subunit Sen2